MVSMEKKSNTLNLFKVRDITSTFSALCLYQPWIIKFSQSIQSFSLIYHLKNALNRLSWLSGQLLILAQVMISQFVGSSPAWGPMLCQHRARLGFSLPPTLRLHNSCSHTLPISIKINKL